jgi:hypothetical protein
MTYRLADAPVDGQVRAGGQMVHVKPPVKLIFYPNERQFICKNPEHDGETVLLGHIYVLGGEREVYEACGGPATVSYEPGHRSGPTPKGKYRLGPRHHHVTNNWSTSSIAFGAPLRQVAVEYEYQDEKGKWHLASGPDAKFTKLALEEKARERKEDHLPFTHEQRQQFIRDLHKLFRWKNGTPMDKWWHNDFGEWAWNLPGTDCYIHTTPRDEVACHIDKMNIQLENSHGCIHLHPKDRDDMIRKGYLRQGGYFEVKGYNEKGPP